MENLNPLTYGQKAVGLTFNPSGDPEVTRIKQFYADIIDTMHELRQKSLSQDVKRYCSTAITQAEIAQMVAVKALTWKDEMSEMHKVIATDKLINFQEDVIEKSKTVPVLMDFFTPTCAPCLELMPKVIDLAKEKVFELVKVNCHVEGDLAHKFQVRSVPRLILYHAGEMYWDSGDSRMSNATRLETISQKLDEIRGVGKATT
jgi:thiol-disulfide isomerase/thioredoxin